MKTLCKHILACVFVVLAALTMTQQAGAAGAKESKSEFTKAEMARMSTFLSNFTELRMMNFTAAEVLNPDPPSEAIHFGIWHNWNNNYKSRIVMSDRKKYEMGYMAIEGKYVLESIEKYFGRDERFLKGLQANQPKGFDGKFYNFMGADGVPVYDAMVQSAETNPDGTITMRGLLHNPDMEENPIFGPFEALARPQVYKGKATWVIISLSVPTWNN